MFKRFATMSRFYISARKYYRKISKAQLENECKALDRLIDEFVI